MTDIKDIKMGDRVRITPKSEEIDGSFEATVIEINRDYAYPLVIVRGTGRLGYSSRYFDFEVIKQPFDFDSVKPFETIRFTNSTTGRAFSYVLVGGNLWMSVATGASVVVTVLKRLDDSGEGQFAKITEAITHD